MYSTPRIHSVVTRGTYSSAPAPMVKMARYQRMSSSVFVCRCVHSPAQL
jgi:hypothetical protein